jgi:hypothetical protein
MDYYRQGILQRLTNTVREAQLEAELMIHRGYLECVHNENLGGIKKSRLPKFAKWFTDVLTRFLNLLS